DVAPVGEVVGLTQADQPAGRVVVERPGTVQHGDVDHVLTGLLALTDDPIVHGDELGHAVVQSVGGAHADFLADGDEQVRTNGEVGLVPYQCSHGGQAGGESGLVVQVAGFDVAVGCDLWCGVQGDEVPDPQPQALDLLLGGGRLVQPDLDLVPAHALGVHVVTEVVSAALEGQQGAGEEPTQRVGEHRDVRALGEAGAVRSDRYHLEACVLLDLLHHAPDRVRVYDDPATDRLRLGDTRGTRQGGAQHPT